MYIKTYKKISLLVIIFLSIFILSSCSNEPTEQVIIKTIEDISDTTIAYGTTSEEVINSYLPANIKVILSNEQEKNPEVIWEVPEKYNSQIPDNYIFKGTFTVADITDTITANVNISSNNSPVAINDNVTVDEDSDILVNVISNDSDADGHTLSIDSFTQGKKGTVIQESDRLRYTPDNNYIGIDSFTYTISDGNGGTATGTVNVNVGATNDSPRAEDDTATVDEDSSILIDVLENDSDTNGDALSIDSYTNGSQGSVSLEGSSLRYTPDADYNGTDSFTYDISDGNGGTATGTVNVTVNVVNDAPVLSSIGNKSVNEGEVLEFSVSASDVEGDSLSYSATGDLSSNFDSGSRTFSWTPTSSDAGDYILTINVSDGSLSDSKTITISVSNVNQPPVTTDDFVNTDEDTSKTIDIYDLLVNDSDPEYDALLFIGFTTPANGTVTNNGDGTATYTPDANFNGDDSFDYEISDGNGGIATGTVNVTINPINDLPVANDDSETIDEDDSILIGVLANDTDVDGDTLAITGFTNGTNGSVVQEDNSLRYTPNADFNGIDSFTYDIEDGKGGIATATVNITVNALNDNPVAADDSDEIDEDGSILIDVLSNDSDSEGAPISISSYTQGTDGTVSQEGESLRYTPDANYNGSDSFTYDIGDGNGGTATGTVYVTINPINDLPVANDDSETIDEDDSILIGVLANDTDVDGDTLSITGFTQGTNGTVAQEGESLRYTPDEDYNGSDSFSYDIGDGKGGIATTTVNMTINALNDAPIAGEDSATINEDLEGHSDVQLFIAVLENDSDIDGDSIRIESFTQGNNDAIVSQVGDEIAYFPDADFNGTDIISYVVTDDNGGTDTADINITVNPINDSPEAKNDSAEVIWGGSVSINVLANDTDVDGDTLSIDSFTQGDNGGEVTKSESVLEYQHNGAVSDSFTYTITDGNSSYATATVNISAYE